MSLRPLPKRTARTMPLSRAFPLASLLWLVVAFFSPPLDAQDIRIKVLNARNGKPVTNECLNVWVGPLHGPALPVPTNHEGVVVLHLEDSEVTPDAVSRSACNGNATNRPRSLPRDARTITIAGGNYVACQEYGKIVPGEPVTPDLVGRLMPSYPIQEILESGVAAGNTCGRFRAQAKPGELIIFVRPTTFWERLRQ